MKDFEKLVAEIMKEAEADGEPVTREEAEEMAKMEIGEKEIKRYEQTAPEKKVTKPKEKKVDTEKAHILFVMAKALAEAGYPALITNVDKTIDFDCFTVTLTRHRPKK